MLRNTKPLPHDIDSLQALVRDKQQVIDQLQAKNAVLQEQLNLALARRYAASSEKITADQLRLFDEAEVDVDTAQSHELGSADTRSARTHGPPNAVVHRYPLPCPAKRLSMN